ncbi:MAG: tail fiber domain-containing protein [Bacteroidota bacterium]
MKSFYFYTLGQSANNGKFIIADWGTDVSGPNHTARLVIANNGNIGIGDYLNNDPSEKLTVDGNALAVSYLTLADQNLSTEVQPLNNALESLQEMQGVSYAFDQESNLKRNLPGGRNFGLIAQQVQKVYPELVQEDANGILAVNYDGLIPVLMEALKAQQAQISQLELKLHQVSHSVDAISDETETGALFQNRPNPFGTSTIIPFAIPETANSARIIISDLRGKLIKSYPITQKGKGEIQLDAHSLEGGMYLYTLLIDGEMVDTKRMLMD